MIGVVNGPTSSGPNPKISARTRKLIWSSNHARKIPKVKLGLKNLTMLLSYFDYIFEHLRQVRLRPKLSPKFKTLGPSQTRTRPENPGPTYNSVYDHIPQPTCQIKSQLEMFPLPLFPNAFQERANPRSCHELFPSFTLLYCVITDYFISLVFCCCYVEHVRGCCMVSFSLPLLTMFTQFFLCYTSYLLYIHCCPDVLF